MKTWPLLLAILTPLSAASSPFLVCDPYPDGTPQPTEFVITVSGMTAPIVSPAVRGPQGVHLKWSAADLRGNRTITVRARNPWGESPPSAPFAITTGAPSSPGGLKIQF